MIEAKRSRFKNPEGRIIHPQKNRDKDVSKPTEAREDHPMPVSDSGGPKTSEFAYFKRLKQGDGRTSRINSVNRGSIRTRNFGPAKNVRGPTKNLKGVRAPMLAKNSSNSDVGSFFSPQGVAVRSSGTHSRVDDDIEMIESSRVIRTLTTIDLDNILSMSPTASINPGTQLKDVDILSSKRHKLQQRILKTLSLEADKLPKELSPSESKNYREPEAQDKCHDQLCDSSVELNERWDGTKKLTQTDANNFLGGGIYPCKMDEDVNTYSSTYADNLVLGFKEGIKQGSPLNEIDSAQKFDMFDDRNLLTWDYSSKYKTGGSIFKNEVNDPFSNIFDGDKSCKFIANGDSYELSLLCYDRCSDNRSRYCLEYKDERLDSDYYTWHPMSSARFGTSALDNLRSSPETDEFEFADNCCRRSLIDYTNERTDCKLDSMEPNNWHPISSARFGSSALDNLRNSPEMDEFADNCCRRSLVEFTNERTGWHPILFERFESHSVDNFRKSAELNEFELRREYGPLLLPWSNDDTNMDYEDMVGRSNCGPLSLLYGSDPLRPHDTGLFEDVFRGIRFYASSNDQHHFIGFDSDISTDDVCHRIDSDISTDDVCHRMPQAEEEWSMNRIKWLDTVVETSYDHLQATVDNL